MNKNISIGYLVRRVISVLIDFSIAMLSTIMIYLYAVNPIHSEITGSKEYVQEYYELGAEYDVFIWNEELQTYIDNPDVTENQLEIFNSIERVEELEGKISQSGLVSISISFIFSTMVFYFLIPLLNKNGCTLGKFALGLKVVNFDGLEPSKKQIIIRESVFIGVELLLGLLLYGILPLISLGFIVFSNSGQSIHDLIIKTNVVSNNKEEIVNEEEDEYYKSLEKEEGRDLTVGGQNNDK